MDQPDDEYALLPEIPRLRAVTLLAAWTVPAMLSCAQRYAFMATAPFQAGMIARVVVGQAPAWYGWAAATPVILATARRFPPGWRSRSLIAHVALCIACLLMHAGLYVVANAVAHTIPARFTAATYFWPTVLSYLPVAALVYAGVVSFGEWRSADGRARARERQTVALSAQLAHAQLGALRAQIQPHFLFNALNTISALVREEDRNTAQQVIARLGGVLRAVLRADPAQACPLREEIALIAEYLDIEQVRFADRLRIRWEVDAETLDMLVPVFILQPLVENALRHGVGRSPLGGELEIGASRSAGDLVLSVRDDGPGSSRMELAERVAPTPANQGHGIGLKNTRARLTQLHGKRASLTCESLEDGGMLARIVLPVARGSAPS